MDPSPVLIPVILSGGAGTRLWPVSRRAHPKPFMRLADGQTLAASTIRRALAVASAPVTLTVTSRDHYFLTRDEYQAAAPEATHHFLLEPEGRNTAPAIAAAALWVKDRYGPEAVLLVLPADHLIRDLAAFSEAVREATQLATQGWLTCLGVQPTHAETGFGYIRNGAALSETGQEILAFVGNPMPIRHSVITSQANTCGMAACSVSRRVLYWQPWQNTHQTCWQPPSEPGKPARETTTRWSWIEPILLWCLLTPSTML